MNALRLNLGCGSKRLPGWCNVDKFGEADVNWDLERFPWPWPDSSADEVLLIHVLEHLGREPDIFIGVMKELYRVCRDGAVVRISVPHPRHDHFLNDPTHVRPILPGTLAMFSRRQNLEAQRLGASDTPLALYHGVDFELVSTQHALEEPYQTRFDQGQLTLDEARELERTSCNAVRQIDMVLKAVKPG
jgi:hypothetical protein